MSHFTVLIIGDDIEGQLAPYDESLEMAPYVIHNKKTISRELKAKVKEFKDCLDDPDRDKKYNVPFCQQKFDQYSKMTPKAYWEELVGRYEEGSDKVVDGKIYSTYNNASKWDWYSIGGRWMGFFKAKKDSKLKGALLGEPGVGDNKAKPGYYDQIRKGDVDWNSMVEDSLRNRAKWWDEAQKLIAGKGDEKPTAMLYFEYGIENGDTRETYINRACDFGVFAFVHKGIWHEQAEMGYWGMTHGEKMSESEWNKKVQDLVMGLPEDTQLTIVDAHI